MKKKNISGQAALLLILVVFVSGCTDALLATLKIGVIGSAEEEMTVIAEVPSFVREGQTFPWNIEVNSKVEMRDVLISVFDKSPFLELVEGEKEEWSIEKLETNRTKTFQSKYRASETEFEHDVEIKFLAEYTANFSASEEAPILDDFEYEDRYSKGTLGEISYTSKADKTPLSIKISFDKDRPFMNDTRVLMYLDYSYAGDGLIDKLEGVEITLPENLAYINCQDYDLVGGRLVLNKEKKFLNKKSVQSTCELQAQGNSPISTGTIVLKAGYTYKITGSAGIELRKR